MQTVVVLLALVEPIKSKCVNRLFSTGIGVGIKSGTILIMLLITVC